MADLINIFHIKSGNKQFTKKEYLKKSCGPGLLKAFIPSTWKNNVESDADSFIDDFSELVNVIMSRIAVGNMKFENYKK